MWPHHNQIIVVLIARINNFSYLQLLITINDQETTQECYFQIIKMVMVNIKELLLILLKI
jgi:hypothetical protein